MGIGHAISVHNSDSECNGKVVDAIPAVNMTSITGFTTCAKRGGPNFLETVRTVGVNNICPEDYVPCTTLTNSTDTVCVREEERELNCPIIDIFVVHQDLIPYL